MNKIFIIIFSIITIISFISCTDNSINNDENENITSIQWLSSFEEAVSLAKAENKPIMLEFYTDWCTWCKEYENVTFVDKDVIRESQNFISVKIDAENNVQSSSLIDKYNIRGYPAVLFLNASGDILQLELQEQIPLALRIDGYTGPENFIIFMEEALYLNNNSR